MHDEGSSAEPSFLNLLAHDLRTPLGGLSAALDVMSYGAQLTPEEVSDALSIAKRQIGRIAKSIEILEILDLLARPGVEPAAVRLDLVLAKAWDRSRVDAALPPRLIEWPFFSVMAEEELLLHLLHTLLRHGGSLRLADSPRLVADESCVTVVFAGPEAVPPITERLPLVLRAAQALAAFLGGELMFHGAPEPAGFRLRLQRCVEG
jgi:signal transduction histidine kinase